MESTVSRHFKKRVSNVRHRHFSLRFNGGFTLTELMVSMIIFTALTTGMFVFLNAFQSAMRQSQAQINLVNQARRVIEEMVWGTRPAGVPERYGLWEARNLNLVSATEVEFRGIDGVERRYRLDGQNIELAVPGSPDYVLYDPNGPEADDLTQHAVNLTFSQTMPDSLVIELVLGRRVVNRWVYATFHTVAALRND